MTARRPMRTARVRRYESASIAGADRTARTPRQWMLVILLAGPVLLILASFVFGVGLQALGLVQAAKHGGLLGGMGGMALTVLVAAFFCVPGYLVAVIWFGIKSRPFAWDFEKLKAMATSIPLIALVMFWVPALLVPGVGLGLRFQIAGLTVLVMLVFGYLWIAVVRVLMRIVMGSRIILHS